MTVTQNAYHVFLRDPRFAIFQDLTLLCCCAFVGNSILYGLSFGTNEQFNPFNSYEPLFGRGESFAELNGMGAINAIMLAEDVVFAPKAVRDLSQA